MDLPPEVGARGQRRAEVAGGRERAATPCFSGLLWGEPQLHSPLPPASVALFQRFTSQLSGGSLGVWAAPSSSPERTSVPRTATPAHSRPRVTPATVQAHPWRLPGALRSQPWKDRRALGCHCARVLLETRWAPPVLPAWVSGRHRGQSAERGSGCHSIPEERGRLSSPGSFVSGLVCQERSPCPQFPWPRRKACSHSPAGGSAGFQGRPEGDRPSLEPGWLPPPPSRSPAGACLGPWPLGTSHLPSSSQGARAAMPIKEALWVALVGTNGQ